MTKTPTEVERALNRVLTTRLHLEALIAKSEGYVLSVLTVAATDLLEAETLLRRRQTRSEAQQNARNLLRRNGAEDNGIPSQW